MSQFSSRSTSKYLGRPTALLSFNFSLSFRFCRGTHLFFGFWNCSSKHCWQSLAVVGECGRITQPSWLLGEL